MNFTNTLNDDATAGNAELTVTPAGNEVRGERWAAPGVEQPERTWRNDRIDDGVVGPLAIRPTGRGERWGRTRRSTGVNVRFANTLNDDATAGDANLTMNASGVTRFGQAVGDAQALTSLTTDMAESRSSTAAW